jgi:hypothetical protein
VFWKNCLEFLLKNVPRRDEVKDIKPSGLTSKNMKKANSIFGVLEVWEGRNSCPI